MERFNEMLIYQAELRAVDLPVGGEQDSVAMPTVPEVLACQADGCI